MKNLGQFLALCACLFIFSQGNSQSVINHQVVLDTLNISISSHQINAHEEIMIGQLEVSDPEGGKLTYAIVSQDYNDLFSVDNNGIIKADYPFLMKTLRQIEVLESKIDVCVKDGVNKTTRTIMIRIYK